MEGEITSKVVIGADVLIDWLGEKSTKYFSFGNPELNTNIDDELETDQFGIFDFQVFYYWDGGEQTLKEAFESEHLVDQTFKVIGYSLRYQLTIKIKEE